MLQFTLPVLGLFVFILLSGTLSELSSILIHLKANAVILTGTLVCCLVSYPAGLFARLFHNISQAFTAERKDLNETIREIEQLSVIRRRETNFKLDQISRTIKNDFLRTGIEMIVDGYDRYTIFKTLEQRYDNFLKTKLAQADLINTMIKLTPVFGFVGTIIGLMEVLNTMGSAEVIGKGVATALLTTFYGLLYANLLLLPIAKKLNQKTRNESKEMAVIIEGVLDICDKINSKAIRYRLKYCIADDQSALPGTARKIPGLKLPFMKPVPKKQTAR